tara:strand:+ start:75 stop:431 length:357 start_codon:yes stop_codon:yes gene_type:complete
MALSVDFLEAISILTTPADLSCTEISELFKSQDFPKEGHENVIIDFSLTDSVEGAELLKNIQYIQDQRDKSLLFCGVKKKMLNLLNEVFGEDFFNIVPTRDEAVDMIFLEEQERELFK